jgi:NAD-dependent DNA ligase
VTEFDPRVIRQARDWGLLKRLPNGSSFCLTGKASTTRNNFSSLIINLGGAVHDKVFAYTDYLICASEDTTSAKAQAAKRNGTKIITEAEFCAMIFPTLDELLEW